METRTNPRRRFIRHTVNVPLEVELLPGAQPAAEQGVNVSHGGLAFTSDARLEPGRIVKLRIPTVEPPFEARARVAWCRPEDGRFLIGAEFLDPDDAFQSRMVQQVCTIENYRREVLEREGRALDTNEAAAEWIRKYGGRFPDAG